MRENVLVCKCKQVRFGDIEDALHQHSSFENVLQAFESVKDVTHCSTGCGGCHDKVMEIISELMMGSSSADKPQCGCGH